MSGPTSGTRTRVRHAGRWRTAASLAGGYGLTATTSTLVMTDDGDVVLGLGGGGADSAREPPVSLGGFWKNSLFYVAVSSLCSHLEIWTSPSPLYLSVLGVWVLPVEYVVLVSGCVRCLVQQWIHVLQEALDEFQYLLRCGELESWGVCSPFGLNGEVCTVDASGCSLFSAVRTSKPGHYFYKCSPFLGSLRCFFAAQCS